MCERCVSRLEVWNYIGLQYTVGAPASPRDSFRLFRVAIAQFSEVKMVRYDMRIDRSVLDPFRFVVSSSAAPFTFILLLGSSPGRRVRGVPLGLGRRSGPGRALTSRCARDHASHGADRAPRRRARAPRSAHRGRHVDKNIKFEISQILASRPSFSGPAGRYPF